jgi:uncharacterized membrane protein required for colicin V production
VKIDLAVAALVLVFGVLGFQSGAISQIIDWVAIAAGYGASVLYTARLTPILAARAKVGQGAARMIVSSFLISVGSLVAAALLQVITAHRTEEEEEEQPRILDEAAGFLLGLGKGAALIYTGLSFLAVFEQPWLQAKGPLPNEVRHSASFAFARAHNLYDFLPDSAVSRLKKLAAAAGNPRAEREAGESDPLLKTLLENPDLRAALKDGKVVEALKRGDLSALKGDKRLAGVLNALAEEL